MSEARERSELPKASRLARAIGALDENAAPPAGLSQARAAIIDSLSTILAGVTTPSTQVLLRTPGLCSGSGEALVFGTSRRTGSLDASYVNAAASHVLEADDSSTVLGGTLSGVLVSALFALGEERKVTGRQLLAAYWVGSEIARGFVPSFHPPQGEEGGHSECVVGTLAVTGAAAHLLRLDEPRCVTALLLAATLSSGKQALTTPLHRGECARHGLLAALLAEHGFVADSHSFEHARRSFEGFEGDAVLAAQATLVCAAGGQELPSPEPEASWEKFCECAARSLPREQIAPLFERLETVESAHDLRQVTRLAELSTLHTSSHTGLVTFAPAASEGQLGPETTWVP